MTRIENGGIRRLLDLILFNNETKLGFLLVSGFVATAIIVALGGPSVVPYDPIAQDVGPALAPPSQTYLFGTDNLGRDLFSRIVFATPNAAFISFVVAGVSFLVGALLGIAAAYWGGILDEILMRITDVFFAIPTLVLAMVIAIILGPGVVHMMYALLIVWWPTYARLARGEALRIIEYNFVAAAKTSGLKTLTILRKHIFPNILTPLVAYATIEIGSVIIVYAGLSYLGLSVRPPTPDWGAMVSAYQDYLIAAPWLPLFPALVIGLITVGFSLLGDGLRDAIESASR